LGNLSTVLLVLMLMVTAGCSAQRPTDAGTTGNNSKISVLDSRGKEIIFDSPPNRIVSLSPAHTEIFYMLGLENYLVGVDSFSDFPDQVSKKPQVGDAFTLNIEAVVGLEPDLIYTTFDGPVEVLEELGLRVLYIFPAKDVKGVLQNIKLLGDITDREYEAKDVIERIESQIEVAKSRLSGIEAEFRVYYELDPGLYTVGDDSFVGDILSMLGLENIGAGSDSPYPKISEEVIIFNDPEIIILADGREFVATGTTVGEVSKRPGWQSITAIKRKSIYIVDGSLISRPGPRIGLGVEKIVDFILDAHSKQS
jgi:iron complex transport system substrate-binding protein